MNLQPHFNKEIHGVYITKSPDHIFLISMEPVLMDPSSVKVRVVPVPRTDSHFNSALLQSCVEIVVGTHDIGFMMSESKSPSAKNYTHVNTLAYGKNCAMTDILSAKQGTNQMFLSALALCVEKIGVEKIQLIDASHFMCEDMVVDLYLHNMLIYGQTWYERKYGAVPTRASCSAALNKAKEALAHTVSGPLVEYLIESTNDEEIKGNIRMQVGVSTWNGMFSSINASFGCAFFKFDVLEKCQEYFHIPEVSYWDVSSLLQTDLQQYLLSYKKIY